MIQRLDWDSDFFSLEIGRMVMEDALFPEAQELSDYNLLYIFVDPQQEDANKILLEKGALLVDEKVTYKKELGALDLVSEQVVSYNGADDRQDEDVIRIGLQSSIYSRFRVDPGLGDHYCRELYRLWMARSIDRQIAREVFVYKQDNHILGVITLGEKNGRGDIGILAVDESTRGMNIGKQLVQKTENYCLQQGYKELQVVTQQANEPACRFYEKCGFLVDSVVNVYHLWCEKR